MNSNKFKNNMNSNKFIRHFENGQFSVTDEQGFRFLFTPLIKFYDLRLNQDNNTARFVIAMKLSAGETIRFEYETQSNANEVFDILSSFTSKS